MKDEQTPRSAPVEPRASAAPDAPVEPRASAAPDARVIRARAESWQKALQENDEWRRITEDEGVEITYADNGLSAPRGLPLSQAGVIFSLARDLLRSKGFHVAGQHFPRVVLTVE